MKGTALRRQREKEQRRKAILDAAEQVFGARGQEGATMEDVAAQAQFSKGLLYKYFQSKEDLYLAISLRALDRLRAALEEAAAQHEKGLDQIAAMGHAYAAFSRAHPEYFDAVVYHATQESAQDRGSYGAACDAAADRSFDLVSQGIARGISDGTIRPDVEPMKAALMLWGKLHGLVVIATYTHALDRLQQKPAVFLSDAIDYLVESMRPRG